MNTYTEAQVIALIQSHTESLATRVAELESKLSQETTRRVDAERKYLSVCERCLELYINKDEIEVDSVTVKVEAPRFLSKSDFDTGMLQALVNLASAERDVLVLNNP